MIGHFVLFIAALVTAATAALGFPSSTASEGCATRAGLDAVSGLRGLPDAQSISVHGAQCDGVAPEVDSRRRAVEPLRRRHHSDGKRCHEGGAARRYDHVPVHGHRGFDAASGPTRRTLRRGVVRPSTTFARDVRRRWRTRDRRPGRRLPRRLPAGKRRGRGGTRRTTRRSQTIRGRLAWTYECEWVFTPVSRPRLKVATSDCRCIAPPGSARLDTVGRFFCLARRTRSSPTTSCPTSRSTTSGSIR